MLERLEYNSYGGPEVVQVRPFTLPNPAANEVVVRVSAASINPVDWKIRNGDIKLMTGSKFPRAMGTDFSGTVETIGSKVSQFKLGDEVVGAVSLRSSGAFARQVITTQKYLVKKPNSLSFAEAACLPVAGVTAWMALVAFSNLVPGQRVFINGAMGAVGHAAFTLARSIGAEVVGRIGVQSFAQAQLLGFISVLDYANPIPTSLEGSFDVVLDCHGSLSLKEEDYLRKRKSGKIIDIVPSRAKFLRTLTSRSRKLIHADPKAANLQTVVDLAAAGLMAIPIAKSISIYEAPALLAALESGIRLNGKAVIVF